jgi:hypothetical protein
MGVPDSLQRGCGSRPAPKGRGSTSKRRIGQRPPAGGLAIWCPRFPPNEAASRRPFPRVRILLVEPRPLGRGDCRGLSSSAWSLVPWGGATAVGFHPPRGASSLGAGRLPAPRPPQGPLGHGPWAPPLAFVPWNQRGSNFGPWSPRFADGSLELRTLVPPVR